MGIMENIPFFFGGFFPLVEFEIRPDRLVQNGMAQIFLSIKYCPDGGHAPQIRRMELRLAAVLRVTFFRIGGGYQDLIRSQNIGYLSGTFPLVGKLEDTLYHLGSFGVNNKCLLIAGEPSIAIGNTARTPLTVLHTSVENGLDLVAGVLGVKLVHDVQKWGKVVIGGIRAVNAVVDSNEAHILFREQNFRIETDLQIVPPEAAHILDNDSPDVPGLDLSNQRLKAWAIEIHTRIAVVSKMAYIGESAFSGVVLQIFLLVGYRVRFAYKVIVP
jgi:hypothetical protein